MYPTVFDVAKYILGKFPDQAIPADILTKICWSIKLKHTNKPDDLGRESTMFYGNFRGIPNNIYDDMRTFSGKYLICFEFVEKYGSRKHFTYSTMFGEEGNLRKNHKAIITRELSKWDVETISVSDIPKQTARRKYQKRGKKTCDDKTFGLNLNVIQDADIIYWLESHGNKQDYLRRTILCMPKYDRRDGNDIYKDFQEYYNGKFLRSRCHDEERKKYSFKFNPLLDSAIIEWLSFHKPYQRIIRRVILNDIIACNPKYNRSTIDPIEKYTYNIQR